MQPQTGTLETLTAGEREVLRAVKNFLRESYGIDCKRVWNHWFILRFCRARKWELPQIVEMIKNYMTWCGEIQMSTIGQIDMASYGPLKALYAHGYYNTDRSGRPVYIEEVRKMQAEQLFQAYSDDQLQKYYVQSYERLLHVIFPECSRAVGRRVDSTCAIMDLKDVNILKLFGGKIKAFINIAIGIGQNYYPETLGSMYVLHAGFLFSGIWAVVKGWVDPKTQKKVNIISGKGHSELAKVIDPASLPVFLGGTCTRELTEDFGPWHDELQRSYRDRTVFHSDPGLVEHFFWDDQEKAEEAQKRAQKQVAPPGHSEDLHRLQEQNRLDGLQGHPHS